VVQALIDACASEDALDEETGVRMIALFDHEEIGSASAQGAGSPVLVDALRRITTFFTKETSMVI
jgi:aspartyl aminopeptidase